jgi:hypothetical protein
MHNVDLPDDQEDVEIRIMCMRKVNLHDDLGDVEMVGRVKEELRMRNKDLPDGLGHVERTSN